MELFDFFNKQEFKQNSISTSNGQILYHAETVARYFNEDLEFIEEYVDEEYKILLQNQLYLNESGVYMVMMIVKKK